MDNSPRAIAARLAKLQEEFHAFLRDAPWKNKTQPVTQPQQKGNHAKGNVSVVTPSPQNPSSPKNANDKTFPWWKLAEGLGILAAVVVAGVNAMQWYDAHNNFKLGQRAWIGTVGGAFIFSAGEKTRWDMVLKNYGASPAIRVNTHGKLAVWSGKPGDPIDKHVRASIEQTVRGMDPTGDNASLPQGQGLTNTGFSDNSLSAEEVSAIQAGNVTLGVFGKTLYRDIFEYPRETDFCAYYDPKKPEVLQHCGFAESMK